MRHDFISSSDDDDEITRRREQARARLRTMFPAIKPPLHVTETGSQSERPDDDFMSRTEAAKQLGVSERTIYRYQQQGRLRPKARGVVHGVRREDVEAFLDNDVDAPELAINRRTLARMHRELVLLRAQVERCKEVLHVRRQPLALSSDELVARHHDAALAVAEGCAPEALRAWTDFLARLSLDDLAMLGRATGDPHPWISFVALSGRLEPTREALHLAASAELIATARQNVDGLAYCWIVQTCGEEQMQRLMRKLATAAPVLR